SSVVEHHLAMVGVAGSNPVFRSRGRYSRRGNTVKSSHPGCGDFCFFRAVIQRSPFTRPVSIFLSKQYRFPVHLFYIHLSPA
ncbi:hypothetical protein, partial [Alistipes sp.]|uniref:hypothetical protein n=1 Tax=Alistipes sp. TaxID=1872444 RepID=UPI003AB8C0A9